VGHRLDEGLLASERRGWLCRDVLRPALRVRGSRFPVCHHECHDALVPDFDDKCLGGLFLHCPQRLWRRLQHGQRQRPQTTITLQYVPDHLTVAFTADKTNGLVPLTVHFSADAVDSGSNAIAGGTWNFGDGTNSTLRYPSHTYTNAGAYAVTLAATNVNGAAVQGIGDSNITASLPTVQFTVTPTNGFMPLSVHFTFPAVDSAPNTIVSWKWDFGDGTSFVDQSPHQPVSMNHIYTQIKTFSPKLTVTNVWGTMISSNGPKVAVLPPPIFFSANPPTAWRLCRCSSPGRGLTAKVTPSRIGTGVLAMAPSARSRIRRTSTPARAYILRRWL